MKKLTYLSALVVGLGMASCSDYHEPNPTVPSTPAESVGLSKAGVTIAPTSTIGEGASLKTIVLSDYAATDQAVPVITITTNPEEFNEEFTSFTAIVQMAKDNELGFNGDIVEFSNEGEDESTPCVTYADGVLSLDPSTVQECYEELVGKNPAVNTVLLRFGLVASSEATDNVRIGGNDCWYGPIELQIKPMDPGFFIEQSYVLYINGVASDYVFQHPGVDAYDDPVFTLLGVPMAKGDTWCVMAPDATDIEEAYRPDNFRAAEGTLLQDPTLRLGVVAAPGNYNFTIDMKNFTFKRMAAYEVLYLVQTGGANQGFAKATAFGRNGGFSQYQGFADLQSDFYFSSTQNFDGVTYGYGGSDGVLALGDIAIPAGVSGLAYVSINLVDMTYAAPVAIESFGVIGAFPASGWSSDVEMKETSANIYTAEVEMETGNEFKVRTNSDWNGINFGGVLDAQGNATLNPDSKEGEAGWMWWDSGTNFKAQADGVYVITLNISKTPYTLSVVKK